MNRPKKFDNKESRDDDFYRLHYGPNAVLTRLGSITLVYLDNPSPALIRKRVEETAHEQINDDALDDNCPLCQMLSREPHEIVYPA